ncbi:N/A [soil metagenome]
MGLIRFLFAMSVLSFHLNHLLPYILFNESVAVSSFFIMSGFYMALVLEKKYVKKDASYWLFISNRLLRIYPIYLITLLVTVLFILLKYFFHIGSADNSITHYFLYANQENINLLERINFVLRNLTLMITTDYLHFGSQTAGFFIVQQAWTLQIELLFYFLVPFLLRLKKPFFLLAITLYLSYFFLFIFHHPFSANSLILSFLLYFIFFLIGIASYFLYQKTSGLFRHSRLPQIVLAVFSLYIIFYQYIPLQLGRTALSNSNLIFYLLFSLALPLIFISSQKSRIDHLLGQLSYPIYIIHLFFIKLFMNIHPLNNVLLAFSIIISTIIASLMLVYYVENPIDIHRQKRLHRTK